MKQDRKGFTMIELVFVIVVLGILAAVAIPKFSATRVDAQISKGRSDVASIRSAIVSERQSRLIKGCAKFIPNGTNASDTTTCPNIADGIKQMDAGGLFGGVLMYPIKNETDATRDGAWRATAGSGTYVYRAGGVDTTFTYNATTGVFTCTEGSGHCNKLIN
jgi:general secretion pathway protein G